MSDTEFDLCACDRCGDPCRVARKRNPDAKMLRHAAVPVGNCINCAVAEWFVVTGLRETTDPKGLLLPHIQEQFAAIMKMSKADGKPAEINWKKVVANWNLPFVTKGHGRTAKRESFPDAKGWIDEVMAEAKRDNVIDLNARRRRAN